LPFAHNVLASWLETVEEIRGGEEFGRRQIQFFAQFLADLSAKSTKLGINWTDYKIQTLPIFRKKLADFRRILKPWGRAAHASM
jgi:hypothetical protein